MIYTCQECYLDRDDNNVPLVQHPWKQDYMICSFCAYTLKAEQRDCQREDQKGDKNDDI